MDQVSCAVSFLLGGFSTVIVMGLFLLFMENPIKKSKDNECLRNIVKDFLRLAQFKQADKMPSFRGAAMSEDLKSPNVKERISIVESLAAGKLGREYTPVPGLLQ